MAEKSLAEKRCKTCGQMKPRSEFWLGGAYANCAVCARAKKHKDYAERVSALRPPRIESEERKCAVCSTTKPLAEFRGLWKTVPSTGERKFYRYFECNACRSKKRRAEALARGLSRSPKAIIDGKIIHPEKLCTKCGATKPIAEYRVMTYGVDKDGGRYPRAIATNCLACEKEHKGHYYDRKADEFRRKQQERRDADPEAERKRATRSYLKKTLRRFGLTPDDYAEMYMRQSGKCKTCGVEKARLAIDHCHKTMKLRGLLCGKCNSALGMACDDPGILRALADYLEQA